MSNNAGDKVRVLCFFEHTHTIACPLVSSYIAAGFPSPADDHLERSLDLNEYMIKHPTATFFVRVEGDSMINAGIRSGDILVVDRALSWKQNSIVVAFLQGEFTVKRIGKKGNMLYLYAENDAYAPIAITSDMDFEVWGVVTFAIHHVR